MQILSHRGYWKTPEERNTLTAFERSFRLGFGTETDVRDLDGRLVISHDPPSAEALPAETFFELYRQCGMGLPLALNIKADGLQSLLIRSLTEFAITNYFVFDMSVPDLLVSLRQGLTVFTRQSEYEREPALLAPAAGVWMDCFENEWMQIESIESHLSQGKRVCLVSPELHRRDPSLFWSHLKTWSLSASANLLLCTDLPEEALAYFASAPEGPTNPRISPENPSSTPCR